ncbi:hypothetical protein [Enterococcus mundtii]|uniref:hypothetical protein n=1 Tax=Enterococcus TaxID=1350 RepID=UPI00032DBAB3|nr:hypothetical protein [Enterococcus mundtii]EOH59640.1 hypothetical protein UAC_02776 [Enterococcus mundtii ATCC 882]EOU11549.1 hypothetical protein I587_00064 [Enterococcus mundtii ATCC 882]
MELKTDKIFNQDINEMKRILDDNVQKFQNELTFYNSEASLIWIIRGCIDYFYNIEESFLGEGNDSGIPSEIADHFSNNIYRLVNAIDYLSKLWEIDIRKSAQIKLLIDIRTLIVHSGEQINDLKSLELKSYKDIQLGRIFYKKSNLGIIPLHDFKNNDYIIQIWADKHDKTKRYNLSDSSHSQKKEAYKDIDIYLNAKEIKNIILSHIEDFVIKGKEKNLKKKKYELPDIKHIMLNQENGEIDFNKLALLVSKGSRGGYDVYDDLEDWDGFGLQKFYLYLDEKSDIVPAIKAICKVKIETTISNYWDDLNDENKEDYEIQSLNILTVFEEYTPKYKLKHYLENQKLFDKIAPFFNKKHSFISEESSYLPLFVSEVEKVLNLKLNTNQNVNDIVCEYIYLSVLIKNM